MKMRRAVDWTSIEAELAGFYDRGQGRPSCPVQLLRILILEQYADLSDREVGEQLGCNLLYRAFVGLGMDEPLRESCLTRDEREGKAQCRLVKDATVRKHAEKCKTGRWWGR